MKARACGAAISLIVEAKRDGVRREIFP